MSKAAKYFVVYNIVSLFVIHNVVHNVIHNTKLSHFSVIMKDKNSQFNIMNDIMNNVVNDKDPNLAL